MTKFRCDNKINKIEIRREKMNKLKSFLKKEIILTVAALFAVVSMLFIPPSIDYINYIDFSVLSLLFCLMAVVEGFKKIGIFDMASNALTSKMKTTKSLAFVLVNLCFFFAMLVTNDVALITFVPLTIGLLFEYPKTLIFLIVMETIAANLGSMLTPIGNPQNLFLYSFFNLDIISFFTLMLPIGILSYLLIIITLNYIKNENINIKQKTNPINLNKKKLLEFFVLFLLCILTVLKLIPFLITLFITIAVLLIFDRDIFKNVDYMLLLTFTAIFIFVGNISSIEPVRDFVSEIIVGWELVASALFSQFISNVPAAVMLSSFTENGKALLLGSNIGGLGTIIASLASLISYKIYSRSKNADKGGFFKIFTIINVSFLIILLVAGGLYSNLINL